MKLTGPIITLGAGLLVAAVLMVMNLNVTKSDDTNDKGALTAATAAPTASATAAPTKPATATTAPVTFAGDVRDGGASIAIAISGDGQAVAYLCDGRSTEAWLQGTASNGELDLRGAGEAILTGTFANGLASGTVSVGGTRWAFSVKSVKAPSGLYRAAANVRNAQVVGGWIVLADGQQVGLLRVAGATQPAPPLDLKTKTVNVNGAPVTVGAVDGTGL